MSGRQLPRPGCSQNFEGLVQVRGAKFNDLLEFGQSCFDVRTQFVKALDLTWIVGDRLSYRFQQFWNVSLRAIVAVEVAALSGQQVAAFARFGFKDGFFESGNIAKHVIGVFDPTEAFSLPTKIDALMRLRQQQTSPPRWQAYRTLRPGRIAFQRGGQIVPDAIWRSDMPSSPQLGVSCFTFCQSESCELPDRRAGDRTPSWKRRSTRTSGAAGRGDRGS